MHTTADSRFLIFENFPPSKFFSGELLAIKISIFAFLEGKGYIFEYSLYRQLENSDVFA